MIEFDCPHCGHELEAEEKDAGGAFTCPRCKRQVTIPGGPVPAPDQSATASHTATVRMAAWVLCIVCVAVVTFNFLSRVGKAQSAVQETSMAATAVLLVLVAYVIARAVDGLTRG